MSQQVECTVCGEQMKHHQTDSGHCRECGGECMDINALYGDGGLYSLESDPEV